MFKIILPIFLSLFILSCSNDANTSNSTTNDAKSLSIMKAPSSSSEVDITFLLAIEFSTSINIANISSSIYLKDTSDNSIAIDVNLDEINDKRILITPNAYLTPSTTYTITVTTDLQDTAGNSLSEDAHIPFTTSEITQNPNKSLSFVDINPQSNATTDVNVTTISIAFDRKIVPSSTAMFEVIASEADVSGTFSYFNSSVTFTPNAPLAVGISHKVTMTNPPTDMYGNGYSDTNATTWSFTTDDTVDSGSYGISKEFDTNTTSAYMVKRFADTSGDGSIIAVARDGGIDLYEYNDGNFTKQDTVAIASKVTDMVYAAFSDNLDYALLVATEGDAIFIVQVNMKSPFVVKKYNYLQGIGEIHGVGFMEDSNSMIEKVYAVGPEIGMRIFDASNGAASLEEMSPVNIDGKALKVFGYSSSSSPPSSYVYVSDYENGLRMYDKNGSSEVLIDGIGDMKFLNYSSTSPETVFILNTIGNLYSNTAGSTDALSFSTSFNGKIVDMAKVNDTIVLATDEGIYIYDDNDNNSKKFIPISGGLVSVSSLDGSIIGLSADGKLRVFEQY